MAKTSVTEIIDLGFVPEMFGKADDAGLVTLVTAVLAEQSALFSARIGASAYDATTQPAQAFVKRAELCLCAAELVQRRINILLGNAVGNGQELDVSPAEQQRSAYLAEAEALIGKIAAGASIASGNDMAASALITSTFDARSLS